MENVECYCCERRGADITLCECRFEYCRLCYRCQGHCRCQRPHQPFLSGKEAQARANWSQEFCEFWAVFSKVGESPVPKQRTLFKRERRKKNEQSE